MDKDWQGPKAVPMLKKLFKDVEELLEYKKQ